MKGCNSSVVEWCNSYVPSGVEDEWCKKFAPLKMKVLSFTIYILYSDSQH